jgi:hypothetical protein
MGRASRRRTEQRASVTATAASRSPAAPRPSAQRHRIVPWSLQEGLEQLAALKQTRDELDASICALVQGLSERGASWGDVGRALHLSRQGARQKYAARN